MDAGRMGLKLPLGVWQHCVKPLQQMLFFFKGPNYAPVSVSIYNSDKSRTSHLFEIFSRSAWSTEAEKDN